MPYEHKCIHFADETWYAKWNNFVVITLSTRNIDNIPHSDSQEGSHRTCGFSQRSQKKKMPWSSKDGAGGKKPEVCQKITNFVIN